ncbi:MAG: RNA polymerase sigma factor [Myxococcota bacterium]
MREGIQDKDAPETARAVSTPTREASEADARLVALARKGDRDAWARLYQQHFDTVLRHLSYLVGDLQLAEDLTQEAFVRGFKAAGSFRGEARFHTWINRIATNVARRHFKRSAVRQRTKLGFASMLGQQPPQIDVEQSYEDEVRTKVLYSALDTLPVPLREAFVLRDLMGVPPEEAADNLGITKGNLAVRAHRARVQLSAELARRGWGGDHE